MSNGNRGTGLDEATTAELERSVSLLTAVTDAMATASSAPDTESTTADDVCDALVASDVFDCAWIGRIDESNEITPFAWAGVETVETDPVLAITTSEETSGDSPLASALRANEVFTKSADESTKLVVPLHRDDSVVGVLVADVGGKLDVGDPLSTALSNLADVIAASIGSDDSAAQKRDSTTHERDSKTHERDETTARRQLRAIFESSFEFLCLLEPDGTVLRVNDAALQFGDHERDEIIGQSVWETPWWHGHESRKSDLKEAISRAARGEFVRYVVEFETGGDEDATIVDFSLSPVFDDDGEVILLVSEGHDITAQRERAQDLQRERERLEFMNRILRHNLLNGLNVVGARADILRDFVAEDGEPHLETIQHRVEEMTELVGTMRTFMKAIVEGETQEFDSRSLRESVESCVERVEAESPNVSVSLGGIPPISVRADELLDEVVENLLKNAIQHNDKPVPEVSVEAAAGDETVELWISDNGPGVPDEQKRKIVEKSIEELSNPGSGFGLFLVREIVESYGGGIRIDDNDPEGATFVVELPRT
ncbi:ATP-binding protein [Haloferax namakaokahaiae]|uniref:histidine kinase n=1 Tax=Haloferax namakaokahaiae TaxID=1748331 RepID=A0ABD5ZET6_9EURY